MKRVLITGGRDFGHLPINPAHPTYRQRKAERDLVYATMDALRAELGDDMVVIAGGATGADACAADWARNRMIALVEIKADWNNLDAPGAVIRERKDGTRYNAMAGPARNARLIEEGRPDLVVAFPGGKGTANMINRARRAGLERRKVGW